MAKQTEQQGQPLPPAPRPPLPAVTPETPKAVGESTAQPTTPGDKELLDAHERIEAEMRRRGITPEQRTFVPPPGKSATGGIITTNSPTVVQQFRTTQSI